MSGHTPGDQLDLDAIEAEWLNMCGPCDGGLPMTCTCATGDPRVPLSALVAEVRRLRARESYTVEQIHEAFAKYGHEDDWGVPSFYEGGLINALRGEYDDPPF